MSPANRIELLTGNGLAGNGWMGRARSLAAALRAAHHDVGGLMIVGTPTDEPWHLVAHLNEQASYSRIPTLSATLVRYRVPLGAPPHLAVDLSRLEASGRNETIFIVAAEHPPEGLLERVNDARHAGATILAIEAGDDDLQQLAHHTLTIDQLTFESAQHLVTSAAGEASDGTIGGRPRRRFTRRTTHPSGLRTG